MKEKIRKTVRNLKMCAFGFIAMDFIIWMYLKYQGAYEGVTEDDYIFQCIVVFMTLISIPLGFQYFKWGKKEIKGKNLEEALLFYTDICIKRLGFLQTPITLIIVFSMFTPFNNTFFFCGCMSFIAYLSCFPSESRLKKELDLPEEIN